MSALVGLMFGEYGSGGTPYSGPTFIAAGTAAGNAGVDTITWPAGHQSGDWGILLIQTANQSLTVSGWTAVMTLTGTGTAGATDSVGGLIFKKKATSSSEADAVTTDSGNHQFGAILVFRGCDGTDCIESAGSPATGNEATSTITLSAITTTHDNSMIVDVVMHGFRSSAAHFSSWANSTTGPVTERLDVGSLSGTGGGISAATAEQTTAGSTGNTTVTHDLTTPNCTKLKFSLKKA